MRSVQGRRGPVKKSLMTEFGAGIWDVGGGRQPGLSWTRHCQGHRDKGLGSDLGLWGLEHGWQLGMTTGVGKAGQ